MWVVALISYFDGMALVAVVEKCILHVPFYQKLALIEKINSLFNFSKFEFRCYIQFTLWEGKKRKYMIFFYLRKFIKE